jgi:hypothetical protein
MFTNKCHYIITNIKLVSEVIEADTMNIERTLAESHGSHEVNGILALLLVQYVRSLARDYGWVLMIYSAEKM